MSTATGGCPSERLNVVIEVTNTSTAAATFASELGVLLSAGSSKWFVGTPPSLELAPGETRTQDVAIVIPDDVAPGDYSLLVAGYEASTPFTVTVTDAASTEPALTLAADEGVATTIPTPEPTPTPTPNTPAAPPVTDAKLDPVAVLAQLDETSRLANDAVMEATGDCMAEAGFEFEPAERVEYQVERIEQLYRPWSSPDPSAAAEFGYQAAAQMPGNLLPPDTPRSAPYQAALYGDQTGTWKLDPDDQVFREQALEG